MFPVSIALTKLVVVLLYSTTSTCFHLFSLSALDNCSNLVDPVAGECIEQALHVAKLPPGKVVKTGKETLYSVIFSGKDPQSGCLGLFHYSYCLFETACNRCKALPGLTEKVANVKKEQYLALLRCQSNGIQSSGQYNLSQVNCESKYPSAVEMMSIMEQLKINQRLMDAQEVSGSTYKTTTENNDLIIIIIVVVIFVVLVITFILLYCFCCKSEDHSEVDQNEEEEQNPSPEKHKDRSKRGRSLGGAMPSVTPFPSNNEATVILPNTSGFYTPASSISGVDLANAASVKPASVPAEPVTPVETALTNMAESPAALQAVFESAVKSNEAPLSVESSDSSKTAAYDASSEVNKMNSANTVELPSAVENSKESTDSAAIVAATSEPSNEAIKTGTDKVNLPSNKTEKSSSGKQNKPALKQVEKSSSVKAKEKIEVSKSSSTLDTPQKQNTSAVTENGTFSSNIDSTNKWNTTAFPSDQSVMLKKVEKSNSDKIGKNPSDLVPQSAIESLKTDMVKLEEKGPGAAKTGQTANAVPQNSASGKMAQSKISANPVVPKTSLKKSDSELSAVDGQVSIPLVKIDSGTSLSSTGSSITSAPSSQPK